MNEIITYAFKNLANYKTRTRRSHYWQFILFVLACSALLIPLAFILPLEAYLSLLMAFTVVMTMLVWSATVRRIHDTNNSGWILLLMIIPILGWIIVFVVLCTDSDKNINKYGIPPKTPDIGMNTLEEIGSG